MTLQQSLQSRNDFADHLRIHTVVKSYKYSECNKVYKLFNPQQSQTPGKPHKCGRCGKALILCSDLTNHQEIHSELKSYIVNVVSVLQNMRKFILARSHASRAQSVPPVLRLRLDGII